MHRIYTKWFWVGATLLVSFLVSTPVWALILGGLLVLLGPNPHSALTDAWAKSLLKISIVLFGFSLRWDTLWTVGHQSLVWTILSITSTLVLGSLLGRWFGLDRTLSILISTGTAICGGSAIAAMSPVVRASSAQTALVMSMIFILNAIALVLFPWMGGWMGLNEQQFGLWCALAIHDTSSVVGAAASVGDEALQIATTVKLLRAFWIVPISMIASFWMQYTERDPVDALPKIPWMERLPWFMIGFGTASVLRGQIESTAIGSVVWQGYTLIDGCVLLGMLGRKLMVGTLFLMGAGLSMKELRKVGWSSMWMSSLLWILVSIVSLLCILQGWVQLL